MQELLDYMPLAYRTYHPAWPTAAIIAGISTASTIIFPIFVISHPIEIVLIAMSTIAIIVTIVLVRTGMAWECRVEGRVLSFRSYASPKRVQIQIADLKEIASAYTGEVLACELAYRDSRRVSIHYGPLPGLAQSTIGYAKAHEKFKNAILAVNPAIIFTKRDMRLCHVCGKRMKLDHFPESRCSECGANKPLRIG